MTEFEQLSLWRNEGRVTILLGKEVVLEGCAASDGNVAMEFSASSRVRTDFPLRGSVNGADFALHGRGPAVLDTIAFGSALFAATPAQLEFTSGNWCGVPCMVRFELQPRTKRWTGTVSIQHVVACVVSPLALLETTVTLDVALRAGEGGQGVVAARLDDCRVEFGVGSLFHASPELALARVHRAATQALIEALSEELSQIEQALEQPSDDSAVSTERYAPSALPRPVPASVGNAGGRQPMSAYLGMPSHLGDTATRAIGSSYLVASDALSYIRPSAASRTGPGVADARTNSSATPHTAYLWTGPERAASARWQQPARGHARLAPGTLAPLATLAPLGAPTRRSEPEATVVMRPLSPDSASYDPRRRIARHKDLIRALEKTTRA